MSRVSEVLQRCREEGRAALIGYLPVGFPTVESSLAAMRALVEGGCDIVEVGFPYSDPVLDGPVIQDAATVALRRGVHLTDVFRATEAVADAGGAAVVMTYVNPMLRYGLDRFAADLAAHGGSGVITPDLIPDEAGDWRSAAAAHGLDTIFLVAPSSTAERLAMTTACCTGFVYVASLMGVTGTRTSVSSSAADLVARSRQVTDTPLCVGLGVSTAGQAAEVAGYADGVIVGSALVRAFGAGLPVGADADGSEPTSTQLSGALDRLKAAVADLATGVRSGQAARG